MAVCTGSGAEEGGEAKEEEDSRWIHKSVNVLEALSAGYFINAAAGCPLDGHLSMITTHPPHNPPFWDALACVCLEAAAAELFFSPAQVRFPLPAPPRAIFGGGGWRRAVWGGGLLLS